MGFAAWIIAGVGAGAVLSIVLDDPVVTGFGAAFGIMFGIVWGQDSTEKDEPDD